jgi:hypothetical protein
MEKCLDGKCCERLPLSFNTPYSSSIIFPNPTHGIVKISLSENNGEKCTSVKIIDSMGKILQVLSVINKESIEIDLLGYASAIYYVIMDFGKSSTSHKVIKQ